jgi:hypothetical protein
MMICSFVVDSLNNNNCLLQDEYMNIRISDFYFFKKKECVQHQLTFTMWTLKIKLTLDKFWNRYYYDIIIMIITKTEGLI